MGEITLPSRGVLYDEDHPCFGGKVVVRDLTTKEEKLLANVSAMTDITSKILKGCIVDPPNVDPETLIIQDRLFLLFAIRAETYGNEYHYQVKCPDCGLKMGRVANWPKDFMVKVLDENAAEPFEVDLPKCGHTIGFRLLRGADELAINRYREKQYAKGSSKEEGDPAHEYTLARRIVSIDGKQVKLVDAMQLFPMSMSDSNELQQAMIENDCGLQLVNEFVCDRCDNDFEAGIPLTVEFFRPKRR